MRIFITTKMTRKNGFTLLEMLAVAALTAMLFSVGITSYARTFNRWSVEQNARQLYMAAKSARVYAVEHQEQCTLALDMESNRFFLMTGQSDMDSDDGEISLVSTPWSRAVKLGNNVSFESVRITGEYQDLDSGIVFRPDGTADNAVVQLGNGKVHYTVMVNGGTSRARLLEGQAEELQVDQIDLDLH